VDRAEGDADGPRILNYVRETAAENGIDKTIRSAIASNAPPGRRLPRAGRSKPSARQAREGTETVRFTCDFLFMCSGYYRYEAGYTPEFAGTQDFAGRIVHSADVAGGSRLRRQARGGDRLGRDCGHSGAGDGQDGRAMSPCCSVRRLCGGRARRRIRSPTNCGAILPAALAFI